MCAAAYLWSTGDGLCRFTWLLRCGEGGSACPRVMNVPLPKDQTRWPDGLKGLGLYANQSWVIIADIINYWKLFQ